jgi:hypothetical protein
MKVGRVMFVGAGIKNETLAVVAAIGAGSALAMSTVEAETEPGTGPRNG